MWFIDSQVWAVSESYLVFFFSSRRRHTRLQGDLEFRRVLFRSRLERPRGAVENQPEPPVRLKPDRIDIPMQSEERQRRPERRQHLDVRKVRHSIRRKGERRSEERRVGKGWRSGWRRRRHRNDER